MDFRELEMGFLLSTSSIRTLLASLTDNAELDVPKSIPKIADMVCFPKVHIFPG